MDFSFKLDLFGDTPAVAPAPVAATPAPVVPAEGFAPNPEQAAAEKAAAEKAAAEKAESDRENAIFFAGGPLPKWLADLDKLDPRTKLQAHLDPYNETAKAK